jgi:hypothetical protein
MKTSTVSTVDSQADLLLVLRLLARWHAQRSVFAWIRLRATPGHRAVFVAEAGSGANMTAAAARGRVHAESGGTCIGPAHGAVGAYWLIGGVRPHVGGGVKAVLRHDCRMVGLSPSTPIVRLLLATTDAERHQC